MKALDLVKNFDDELYQYFVKEVEHQHACISFIPDENSTSPICAELMGSVLVNSKGALTLGRGNELENIVTKRLCKLFNAQFATVKTITIEAASRVVFKALTQRGDIVMSLDLRKKEHCNSENLAYRFINYGVEPNGQILNYDQIEAVAVANQPKLIIISPVNYSLLIDFKRMSEIAKKAGALLWCDLSQTAGLTAAQVLPSPVQYADVVTFSTHGAMQGPQAAVILCREEHAGLIIRAERLAGHNGLLSSQLSALGVRLQEMQTDSYKKYCENVILNAKALSRGLEKGGMKIISKGTDTHLVMIDSSACAISARGAQELLADLGIHVRITQMLTNDAYVKFDAVRFSTLPVTTRGMNEKQMETLGEAIGSYLLKPDDEHGKKLVSLVAGYTATMPAVDKKFLEPVIADNLENL